MTSDTHGDLDGIRAAKQRLGVDHLLFQIHDASFPSDPDEDFGRGSPYSHGADRLYRFAAQLGFDGIQLGPQGMTSRGQWSPYEGTLFSRNPLNLPLCRLASQGRLSTDVLAACRQRLASASAPPALTVIEDIYDLAIQDILRRADDSVRKQARMFLAQNAFWLIPDALYSALCREHQSTWYGDWRRHGPQGAFDERLYAPFPGEESQAADRLAELRETFASDIENYAVLQWHLADEHHRLRERLSTLGLSLFADLQVGLAPQDAWSRRSLYLTEYRLGAPPSRTNADGQPWGFAVLDPRQYGTLAQPGPVLQFVQARLEDVLSGFDGVRIDHPHGWVDPWVYRADDSDPLHAVQNGARLFSSPNEPGHPDLAAWAIARPEQINRQETAFADRRVRDLDDDQVEQYARQLEMVLHCLDAHGRARTAIACEVLSTLPYPIQRVLERFGLGRFRVTSKLKLDDPADVYRIEQAQPEDWIMLGTHDTATIWNYADEWFRTGTAPQWGIYLASLLSAEPDRAGMAAQIADAPGALVNALFAAMLASRAKQVSVFFPDVFGMTERYNRPGTSSDENWRLRVPADFETLYESRSRAGAALDVPRCLEMARARCRD